MSLDGSAAQFLAALHEWRRNIDATSDRFRSLMGNAHAHGHRSPGAHSALVSLHGGDHLGRVALLFQSGQRPFHEAGGRWHEAEGVAIPDPARPELVPLERAAHGFRRFLVLGASLCWTGRGAHGGQPIEHNWPLPAYLDWGLGDSLRGHQASADWICSWRYRRSGCD